jgi:hypothetical protein
MRAMLAVICVFALVGVARAQPQAQPRESKVQGTIMSMEGSVIFVRDEATDLVWRCDTSRTFLAPNGLDAVIIPDPVTIELSGTEYVSNLRVGMGLQFNVKLTNKRATDEVSEATLFVPSPATKLGILETEPIAGTDDADKKGKPQTQESCLIAGTIAKPYKNGALTINYPSERGNALSLTIRMPSDATITIAADNLSLARPGDKIEASGSSWVPQHFLARNIKIEHIPPVNEELVKKGFIPKKFKPMEQPKKERAPFELGDPEDNKPAVVPVKAKVRLELLKVN